jgi:hypothetical protein
MTPAVLPAAMVDALACQLYHDDAGSVPDGADWLPWHALHNTDQAVACHDLYHHAAARLLTAAFTTGQVTQQWAIGYPDSTDTAILGGWWDRASVPTAMLGYPDDLPAGAHLVRRVVVASTPEVAGG